MSQVIGWVGAGRMGAPMVKRLSDAGHRVVVHRRNGSSAGRLDAGEGIEFEQDLSVIARRAHIVVTCVPGAVESKQVWMGEQGMLRNLAAGSVAMEMSTVGSPHVRELAEVARESGVQLVDCPVSGGPAAAAAGTLSLMVGADDTAAAAVRPLLDLLGRAYECGDVGAGQQTKIVNQTMLGAMMSGLGAGFAVGRRLGLDLDRLGEVLMAGVNRGYLLEVMWPRMISGEIAGGFSVELMRKDLSLCAAELESAGVQLPLLALVDEQYRRAQEKVGKDAGTQVIFEGQF